MKNVSLTLNNLDNFTSTPLVILYRSLYILREKFQKYKSEIIQIYKKYEIDKMVKYKADSVHLICDIKNISEILKEVLSITNLIILPVKSPQEIFFYNFIQENDQQKYNSKAIKEILIYISPNFNKYNKIYFNKKIFLQNIFHKEQNLFEIDITQNIPIAQYDKKGRLIKNFEEMKIISNDNNIIFQERIQKEKEQSEYEYMLTEKQKIFIETIPIFIADFLQIFPNYAIIDLESSNISEEVKNLFDDKIIQQIANERKNITKEITDIKINGEIGKDSPIKTLLKEKLQIIKNIQFYEKLSKEKKKKNEVVTHIETIIKKLYKEKEKLENLIKAEELNDIQNFRQNQTEIINNKNISDNNNIDKNHDNIKSLVISDEIIKKRENICISMQNENKVSKKRTNNLKEIFNFYTNQHKFFGHNAIFDSYSEKNGLIDMAEWSKFCSDFNINIPKEKIYEIFRKNSPNFKFLNFDEFNISLHSLSNEFINWKKLNIEKEIENVNANKLSSKAKELKMKTENISNIQPNNKEIKFETPLDNQTELENLRKEYDYFQNMNYDDKYQYFLNYINLDNPSKYKKNFKGFNKKNTNYLLNNYSEWKSLKDFSSKSSISHKLYENIKTEKEIILDQKKQKNHLKKILNLNKRNEFLEKHSTERLNKKTYNNINERIKIFNEDKKKDYKFNWDKIEKTEFDDLNLDNEDKEFFLDNDNPEDIELIKNLNINENKDIKDKNEIDKDDDLVEKDNLLAKLNPKDQSNILITQQDKKSKEKAVKLNKSVKSTEMEETEKIPKIKNHLSVEIGKNANENERWEYKMFGPLPDIFPKINSPLKVNKDKNNIFNKNEKILYSAKPSKKTNFDKNEIMITNEILQSDKQRFINETDTYHKQVSTKKEIIGRLLKNRLAKDIEKFNRETIKKNIYPYLDN